MEKDGGGGVRALATCLVYTHILWYKSTMATIGPRATRIAGPDLTLGQMV